MLRKDGQPAFNFIHFTSPAIVVLDGTRHTVGNAACIVYTPGHRQDYMAHGGSFKNDYITVQVNDADFLTRIGLPANEIFYIRDQHEITHRLEWISWAVADKTEPHGKDIDDAITAMFQTLGKLRIINDPQFNRLLATKQRFIALRDEMRKDPGAWNIEKMSQKVWLTRSRFSVLYNEFFGVPPNADLIGFKIEHAKHLLATTTKPIATIAASCGHKSVEHFTRIFAKHVGQTPSQYRKNNAAMG